MLKYSWFSLLRTAVSLHHLSVGLVLSRRTMAATAIYETYTNTAIVKKYKNVFFFFLNINSMDSRKVKQPNCIVSFLLYGKYLNGFLRNYCCKI